MWDYYLSCMKVLAYLNAWLNHTQYTIAGVDIEDNFFLLVEWVERMHHAVATFSLYMVID